MTPPPSPEAGELLAVTQGNNPKDVCRCGDYRDQHGQFGCTICNSPQHSLWECCMKFRLEERAHG